MVRPIGVGRWPIGHVSPIGLLLIQDPYFLTITVALEKDIKHCILTFGLYSILISNLDSFISTVTPNHSH